MRFLRSDPKGRLRAGVAAAALLAGMVVVAAPPVVAGAADGPVMTATPAAGMSGDQVVLHGTACGAPGAPIDLIFFNGTDGATAGHVTLDDSGSFTTTVTVPWSVSFIEHPRYAALLMPGDFQFVALDRSVAPPPVCGADFHVTQSVALALAASPSSGPAGSTVRVSLACFEPWQVSLDVHAEVDGVMVPGSTIHGLVDVGTALDMPLAQFEGDVTLPADLAVGTEVQLVGTCTGVSYTPATFVVVVASTSTTPPPAVVAAAVTTPAALTG